MWKLTIFALFALVASEKATFDNYKVFRATPTTPLQLEILRNLENNDGLSFWHESSFIYEPVDIMVAPHKLPEFLEMMKNIGIRYQLLINDVQSLIDKESPVYRSLSYDFTSYHTLDEIYEYLDNLTKAFPDNVEVIIGGKTYEGRQIKGVKVSFKQNNPGIFIEGGIHAREWISPATVIYVLHELLYSNSQNVRQLAESHDWYMFPVFNPDGYVYTHTKNRLWRKTRKPYSWNCYGTDLNRNWDYKWMTGGASSNPCAETFAGTKPFSDIESTTLAEYIASISDKFYAYISFHSYSQLLLFPYGHTTEHLDNYDELLSIGKKTISALARRHGTEYVTGNVAETIYVATGSTVDWIKGVHQKPITYTYELRDRGWHGFLLPADQIIPTGEETLDSLIVMFEEAKARGYPKGI